GGASPRPSDRPSRTTSAPDAAQAVRIGENGAHGVARRPAVAGVAATLQRRQQGLAGAGDPAFHGADGALADVGGLLVGEASGPDQDQRLALLLGQGGQRQTQFV